MAQFNPDFWEVGVDNATLEQVPEQNSLWYQTDIDRERSQAMREFFESVRPSVDQLIEAELTERQREVLKLYYFYNKTQEDIAAILNLSQSTVSRHLFGTPRSGKKIGGAIPKLRKVIDKGRDPAVNSALDRLQDRMAKAV